MALFNLVYSNHGENPVQLEDFAVYLELGLRAAGNDFHLSPILDTNAVNVFVDCFEKQQQVEELVNYAKAGVKIILIPTENVSGNSMNNIISPDDHMNWATRREYWDDRYRNFLKIAEISKHIWCFGEDNLDSYKTILPHEWVHLIPCGYADGFISQKPMTRQLKDIDFLFTGLPTRRRQRILKKLESKGFRVISAFKLTDFIRTNMVSRTKISLGLKQFDEWKVSSLARNYYHLMSSSYLISENCEIRSAVDEYITIADSDDFVDTCLEMVERDDLDDIATSNLERFRQEKPIAPMFVEFLEKSLHS